jgi:hypothetical protein
MSWWVLSAGKDFRRQANLCGFQLSIAADSGRPCALRVATGREVLLVCRSFLPERTFAVRRILCGVQLPIAPDSGRPRALRVATGREVLPVCRSFLPERTFAVRRILCGVQLPIAADSGRPGAIRVATGLEVLPGRQDLQELLLGRQDLHIPTAVFPLSIVRNQTGLLGILANVLSDPFVLFIAA